MADLEKVLDDSKNIQKLLARECSKIEELKSLLGGDFPPILPAEYPKNACTYDDIFLLRYILSYKTAHDAAPMVPAYFWLLFDTTYVFYIIYLFIHFFIYLCLFIYLFIYLFIFIYLIN